MIIRNKSLLFQTIVIFLFFCVLSILSFKGYCKVYKNYGFDAQALLTWDYSSYKGLLPYKDTFYPYGLLPYYESTTPFLQLISFLIGPTLYTLFFIVAMKVWQDKLHTVSIFIFLYFYIEKFIGQDVFNRYGIITILACILAYFFLRNSYLPSKIALVLGVVIGLMFSLVSDQGAYGVLIITLFIIFNPIIKYGFRNIFSRNYYKNTGKSLILFSLGVIIGLIPFLIYLIYNNIIYDFYVSLIRLSDSALYAKTPFFPYSRSPENLFTFTSIFLTIFYITYNRFFRKIDFNFISYLQLSLVFVLILLEQKSLIRSISEQITFISLLLFILLFYELKKFLEKLKINSLLIFIFFSSLVIFVFYKPLPHPFKSIYDKEHLNPKACLEKNVNKFLSKHKEYALVKKSLEKDLGYKKKIFSFPGDPIFYILNKQIPPYYSNVYDSSSLNAQEKQVEYIKENDIQYIIYNKKVLAVQDGVPDLIRANFELKFILNNFTPVDKVGDFILFKKKLGNDIFKDKFLDAVPKFRKYLLQIDFAAIPKAEGIHKKDFIKSNNNIIFSKSSVQNVNLFLENEFIKSNNTVFVIWGRNENKEDNNISIILKTSENLKTTIFFHPCSNRTPCIINLSKLPLFYKNRIIKQIIVDANFEGSIEIRNKYNDNTLW